MNDEIRKIKKELSEGLITEKQAALLIESISADKNGKTAKSGNFTRVAVLLAAGIIVVCGIILVMSKKESAGIVKDDSEINNISPVNKSVEQSEIGKTTPEITGNQQSAIQKESAGSAQATNNGSTNNRVQKNSISKNSNEISGNKDKSDINKGITQISDGISAKLKVAPSEIVNGSAQSGPRSKGAISRVVMRNIASVRYAYNKRLAAKPSLKGRLDTKFSIDANGDVVQCIVTASTLNDQELESIIVLKIKTWKFEKMEDGKDITEVVYPFLFNQ